MVPPIPVLTRAGGVWLLASMRGQLCSIGEIFNIKTKASESNQNN